MKKVLLVFGTRPEVIKMAPICHALTNSKALRAVTCATAQHRDLLDQPLAFFAIRPDFDLNLMREWQDLFDVTAGCLTGLRDIYRQVQPDLVLVQGDTMTAVSAALAAFYLRIKVGHVEAGLRTGAKFSPFPEEINRRIIAPLADFHFAPTLSAVQNLKRENISEHQIFQTGNTGIDALLWARSHAIPREDIRRLYAGKKLILLTVHRRETFGEPQREIFGAIREFLRDRKEFHAVYPLHPNPNVQQIAREILGTLPNLSLIAPLSYGELVPLLSDCHLVITDSGGLQEEAPTLGKPVLILRETTERPEAVTAGCSRLVGHDRQRILEQLQLLADESSPDYQGMTRAVNPFGDGTAATQIVGILESQLAPKVSGLKAAS